VQVVGEAVALQPGDRGFQLGQRHHGAALLHHSLEGGRVGVVRSGTPRDAEHALVLDYLGGHHLA
jgi:hypothetical protein